MAAPLVPINGLLLPGESVEWQTEFKGHNLRCRLPLGLLSLALGLPALGVAAVYAISAAPSRFLLFLIPVLLTSLFATAYGIYLIATRRADGPSQDSLLITNLRAVRVRSLASTITVLSAVWGSDAAAKIIADNLSLHPLRLNLHIDLADAEASEFLKLASVRQEHALRHPFKLDQPLEPLSPPLLDLPPYVRPLLDRHLAQHYPDERPLVASFSTWQTTVRFACVTIGALLFFLPYMIAVPFLRIFFCAISILCPLLVAALTIGRECGLASGLVLTNRRILRIGTLLPACSLLFSARQVADLSDPAFRERYLNYELCPRDSTGDWPDLELRTLGSRGETVQALCNYLIRVATHTFGDKTENI